MEKRKIIISTVGVVLVVTALLSFNFFAPSEENKQAPEENNAVKSAVNILEAKPDTIVSTYEITGRVVPQENIGIYAEVGGIASFGPKPFKNGIRFQKGDLLLSINSSEFSNTLKATKSQFKSLIAAAMPDIKLDFPAQYDAWRRYLENVSVKKPLPPLPASDDKQFSLFLSGRDILSNYYSIQEQQARLEKYYIRAPFKGAITETFIDRGTLVRVGQQLGEFISSGSFELEASVAYGSLNVLKIGQEVTFTDINGSQEFTGTLKRINEKVNAENQLVKVYFEILDDDLRAGVYLQGNLKAVSYADATRITAEAIVNENYIYVVEDGKAKLKEVEVLESSPNDAVIRGVAKGTKIITDQKNSAFEGSSIIEMQ